MSNTIISKYTLKDMILKGICLDNVDYSHITDMSYMFKDCNELNEIPFIDTSNVTNMEGMFKGCRNFNGKLDFLNTCNVTNMKSMFEGCIKFNKSLNNWDVSNVESMENMFKLCSSFDQPLNSWNVENVCDMSNMFYCCFIFNQDLSSWNVENVLYFDGMFHVPNHALHNICNTYSCAILNGMFTPLQLSLLNGYGIYDPDLKIFNGYDYSLKSWQFHPKANIFNLFLDHIKPVLLFDAKIIIDRLFYIKFINDFTYKALISSSNEKSIDQILINTLSIYYECNQNA